MEDNLNITDWFLGHNIFEQRQKSLHNIWQAFGYTA
jgi:hypothetical protein